VTRGRTSTWRAALVGALLLTIGMPLAAPGGPVTFTYDPVTHVISDDLARPLMAVRGAHWLRRDVIAWNPPDGGGGVK